MARNRLSSLRRFTFTAAVVVALVGVCRGAPPKDLVKASLLADVSSVKAGDAFTVGVLLEMAPGWHIYWQNPGDSGMATSVKVSLPDGYQAGPVLFPTPLRFVQPGGLVAYGYDDSVMLTVRVTPPEKVDEASPAAITAAVEWLVCRDVCVPGEAKVTLSLPMKPDAAPANAALFRRWTASVPTAASEAPDVEKAVWAPGRDAEAASLLVTWKQPPGESADIGLFPMPDDALDVRLDSVRTEGRQSRIAVRVHHLAGHTPKADRLVVVLGYADVQKQRRGVVTEMPLPGANRDAGKTKSIEGVSKGEKGDKKPEAGRE